MYPSILVYKGRKGYVSWYTREGRVVYPAIQGKEGVVYPGIQGKEGLRILIYKGKKSCVS